MIFLPIASNVSYHPLGTGHDGQRMNIFRGKGYPPKSGRPVFVTIPHSGWSSSQRVAQFNGSMTEIVDRLAYALLQRGWIVVSPTLTVVRGAPSPNNVNDASYNPASGLYGQSYTGNGTNFPPGSNPGAATVEPFLDLTRPTAMSDVFYVRKAIAQLADQYGMDNGRVVVAGVSSGGFHALHAAFSRDRREDWGAWDEHSTTWSAALALRTPTRHLTVGQTLGGWAMFPNMNPLNGPAFDVVCGDLADTIEATHGLQAGTSPLNVIDTTRPLVPTYLAYNNVQESTVYLPPYEDGVAVLEPYHGRHAGAYIKALHPGSVRLVSYGGLAAIGLEDAQLVDDGTDASVLVADMVSWLLAAVDVETTTVATVPAALVSVHINKASSWIPLSSTSNTVYTQVFAANAKRKKGVAIYNVGSEAIRVGETETPAHLGVLLYGATQLSGVTGTTLGPCYHLFEGTEDIWFKRNGATGTANIVAVEI